MEILDDPDIEKHMDKFKFSLKCIKNNLVNKAGKQPSKTKKAHQQEDQQTSVVQFPEVIQLKISVQQCNKLIT